MRASERAIEQAKKRKAAESKVLALSIEEADARALVASSIDELELRRKQLADVVARRQQASDELSEVSKN